MNYDKRPERFPKTFQVFTAIMALKRIPEEIINEIRHQADLVEVISEYVPLKKTGSNYKGLCPFHSEKTPSFVVSPAKQIFHCYGCGAGGNVFTFLMQQEKYTFPEAIQVLAKRLGIQISEQSEPKATQQLRRSEGLYQLHHDAAQYFSQHLTQSDQGQQVREYLKQRGIYEKSIQTFSLGYALPSWDGLWKTLIQKYSRDFLLESGLVIKKKSGVGHYDRFRDRLMIPIHDERGRIVAFGGRILGEGEPKYLNSPETSIFHKGRTLFGIYHAKDAIRRLGSILVVEGYFDMIVPYNYGVENIVATMGTALTEHHLRQIQRYTKNVVLVFDSDPAGIKAVLRTLDLFLSSGFEARAVVLPKGEDPDSIIRKEGAEKFRDYVDHAPLLLDFVRERILEQYDLSRVEQQIKCVNQLLPTILKIRDIVERDIQINRTADILKISDKALLQEFKRAANTGKAQLTQTIPKKRTAMPILEEYLIRALIKDKSLISVIQEELNPEEDLSSPIAKRIVKELFVYKDQRDFEARILDDVEEMEIHQDLADLFMRADEIVDPAKTVRDCLDRLRQKCFEHATLDVTRKVRNAQEKKDTQTLDTVLEQKNKDLLRKKANLYKKNEKL